MIFEIKDHIKRDILETFNNKKITAVSIEKPKDRKMGDFAIPCFIYSKILKQSPIEIAKYLKLNIENDFYEKVEATNGYLNIFINKIQTAKQILEIIKNKKENYGNLTIGQNKTIVIDYSAPNIAKPFNVGHLRTTVIGNSIKKIHKKIGYKVVGINHLGDWGTQFGKLIYAYKRWGIEEKESQNLISELKKLYIKFHKEAEKDENLNNLAREWFKKLEEKDEEAIRLWEWFKDESIKEFMKTYELLNITGFESYNGESFYIDKMQGIISELEEKELLIKDDGALIVDLGEAMPPALIKKSDGSSLYMTRDLAAAFYRKKEYNFDECLYVVGNEQTLHFMQLKEVIKKMGYKWYENLHHISFGMILENGKRMSTRTGRGAELALILEESINLAKKYIEEKNPLLENKKEVSKMIGVGAIIFNDLKNYRKNDVDFNMENILKFEGETGPYIQYTHARIKSLLIGSDLNNIENYNITKYSWQIILDLIDFEEIILKAKEEYDPSIIAKYVIDVAQNFNKLYATEKIVINDLNKNIAVCVSIVLKEGMRLLGINVPEKM